MTNLNGKVAVVIGAAGNGNMGQVIARRLAGAGVKVVVSGRKAEPLKALAAEIGGDWIACDITKKAEVDHLARETVKRHGKVDIAINATGWGLLKPLTEISEDELDGLVALQFKGVHHFLAAFVTAMVNGGSIIQISSASTFALLYDHAAYIGTKAGADALVRCVANQYGAQGIRANSIAPGLTSTPMTAGAMAAPGLEAAFAKEYPLGRIGTSDDVAAACLWLASDDCFMTGQTLQVNGGLTLRRNPLPHEVQAAVGAAVAALQAGAAS
jgi:NAD(P)-dependent dehydrogenase (short-subunit alcohol dehydrogenase family)